MVYLITQYFDYLRRIHNILRAYNSFSDVDLALTIYIVNYYNHFIRDILAWENFNSKIIFLYLIYSRHNWVLKLIIYYVSPESNMEEFSIPSDFDKIEYLFKYMKIQYWISKIKMDTAFSSEWNWCFTLNFFLCFFSSCFSYAFEWKTNI